MAQPITAAVTPVTAQPAANPVAAQDVATEARDPRAEAAGTAAVITALCTLFNPITGAAVGTYFITSLGMSYLSDMLGCDNVGLIGKVARAVTNFFVSAAATVAVLSALGVAITFSPALMGAGIGLLSVNILSAIGKHGHA
jgi:hypothetical protein